jgi:error-prone DNA polymerase
MFSAERVLTCDDVSKAKHGSRVTVAGVVLVRQRPGKGNAIFITLEDETGIANVLLWARDFEKYRMPVMAARLLEVHGILQKSSKRDGRVIHVMGARAIDRSAELGRLSEDHPARITLSRADEFEHPSYRPQGLGGRRHPRNVRILPPSRDFH